MAAGPDFAREEEAPAELPARGPGALWGSADYDVLARRFAAIHDEVVRLLEPRPGEAWLDVATGTGEVALRAAAAGADVTALDISPGLLEQARAKRGADAIRWDLGDAQRLPYEDRRFDVVSSVFGVIFAPDHAAAARELARVSRPGGRLGLVTWRPDAGPHALLARFTEERPASDPEPWGSEERVSELLGETFELEFGEGVWHLEGATPEAVWDFFSASVPPLKAFAERLDPERHGEFRQALIEHWEGFRTPAGVREPRPYLVVLGTRR